MEQSSTNGQLVQVTLPTPLSPGGSKKILLQGLAGPMGVAVDDSAVYVQERHKNRVQRVLLSSGEANIFATGLNSPIGVAIVWAAHGAASHTVVGSEGSVW